MSSQKAISFYLNWYRYPFTENYALRNINVEINYGEVFLVSGRDGAGKSTFCRCLNGLAQHFYEGWYDGTIIVDGVDVSKASVAEMSKHVAYVFDNPELQLLTGTVEDEVAFTLENYGYPEEIFDKLINEVLELMRLKELKKRAPYTLSGGEKQALALASMIVLKPKILVLDEPTANLDPEGRERFFSVLNTLAHKENTTIVIVEQKVDEIAPIADKMMILDKGEIKYIGTPREILSKSPTELKELGVKVPEILELKYKLETIGLSFNKTPLTVEETWTELREILTKFTYFKGGVKVHKSVMQNMTDSILSSNEPIINIENLWFRYSTATDYVLKEINLKVYPGESVAIIGQNGSGKTTLAKHLNGLLKPMKGKVIVDGKEVSKHTVAAMSRYAGYIFQNPDRQIFKNRVRDEVAFGPSNLGVKEPELTLIVKKVLEQVGLLEYIDKNPIELSRAERQKLAFACVIAMNPKILIIDEPATGQDYNSTIQIMEIVKKLNLEGVTTIIISHDMELVAKYCKRTILMYNGKILIDAPTWSVFSQPDILAKSSIKPPSITRLSYMLAEIGFSNFTAITAEDFFEFLQSLLVSQNGN